MSLKTNKLRDAITLALAVGMTSLAGTSIALAQTTTPPAQTTTPATDDDPTTLDRIVVTGSRIRQVDLETAQPVTLISRQDIEKQGFQSVADILQNISATGTPPISRASPLSAGEASGGTYISLRNLGAERTLILLDGKRLGITTSGLSDVASIPAASVERIEVLKDGASSIYGSDAIAGVINIITRKNFNGAVGSVYLGQYDQGDGETRKGDFVIGFNKDRIGITVGAEYRDEEVVLAKDRDFSAFPRSHLHPTDGWTPTGQVGGFSTTLANPVPGFGVNTRLVLRPGGNPRVLSDYIRQDINTGSCVGATAQTGCSPGSTLHKSNTNEQTDLRTPVDSRSMFANLSFEITDNTRLVANVLYNDRHSSRTVAGYPMQAAATAATAPGMSAFSYFNPTGRPITTWWRRTWEVPRYSDSDLKVYRISAALEGSLEWGGSRYLDWDVGFLSNESRLRQRSFGNLHGPNTQRAVGPSFLNADGRVQCGTAAAPVPFSECVPFNPYLEFGVEGQGGLTNNDPLRAYLFKPEQALGDTKTQVFHANVAGPLFTLPAGDLAFAFGLERREESGSFTPDPLSVSGLSTNLGAGPTRGEYNVDEAYVEFEVPVLANLPFAQELTLNLASRYSDYDTFGETTNNKIGLKWKPFESLLIRATAADGFRAPTIANLFGGGSQTFSFYTDPCDVVFGQSRDNPTVRANCVAAMGPKANTFRQLGQGFVPVTTSNTQTPVPFISGSNPLLQPEEAKSQTIGLVWSPHFAEGLNFAVDWWKIRLTETIVADSPGIILNDCYVQGITSRCAPELFTREAERGFIDYLKFGSRNAGFRKIEGYDFDVSYRLRTQDWGNYSAVLNSTYTKRDFSVSTNDPRRPLSSVGFANFFRVRANLNLGWEMGDFGVSWISRYYSSIKESCTYVVPGSTEPNLECNEITFAPTGLLPGQGAVSSLQRRNKTGSVTFNDVQFRWQAPWDATISVGANNVFEKYGPVLYAPNGSANVSYYGGFDIGRFWYLKYTQRF